MLFLEWNMIVMKTNIAEIYETETSDRAFEEEVMLVGFGNAPTKSEGSGVQFDTANEAYTASYTHETNCTSVCIN